MNELLQCIADTVVCLDQQIKELKEIYRHFLQSKKGKACLIIGPKLSGKTLLINHVSKHYENEITSDSKRFIDGEFCDDSHGTNIMNEIDFDERSVLIVDNFEQFAKKSRQQLLYTIMNKACSANCLVILTSSDYNCTDRFEKRVRSRMSQKKITIPFDNKIVPIDAFCELLIPEIWINNIKKDDYVNRWVNKVEELANSKYVKRDIDRIWSRTCNIGLYRLKQLAILTAIKYFESDDEVFNGLNQDFINLGNIVSPNSTIIKAYLLNFHIQELFILELIRQLTNRTGDRFVHQINIFRTFSRLFNSMHRKSKHSKKQVYSLLSNLLKNRVVDVKPGCQNAQPDFVPLCLKISNEMVEQVWKEKSKKSFLSDVFVNAHV